MRKSIIIISTIFIMLLLVVSSGIIKGNDEETQHVLVIYSHHMNFQWVEQLQKGLTDSLVGEDLYIYPEYLNEHQLSDSVTFEENFNAIKSKYQDLDFDCIIVADNYAYNFLEEYYDQLAPHTPIVFVGVNGYSENMKFSDNITGIAQNNDMKALVDLILSVNDTDEIIFLTSLNATSMAAVEEIRWIMETSFLGANYRFISEKTLDEVLYELEGVKQAQLVMIGNIITGDGTILNPDKLLETVFEASQLPIYTANRLHIKEGSLGAVGGVVVDPYVHAYEAGLMTKQILMGTPVEEIPVMTEPLITNVFNYKMIEFFEIDESVLPVDSILLGKEDNHIYVSREMAISFSIIGILIILVLAGLLLMVRQKANDRNKMNAKNQQLEIKNQAILKLINEDQVTNFMNHNYLEEQIIEIYDQYDDFVLIGIAVKNLQLIDEAYGHDYGNLARKKISTIIRKIVEHPDVFFARYHDSFYILDYSNLCCEHQLNLAHKLQKQINRTISVEEYEVELSANIGLVRKSDAKGEKNMLKLIDTTLVELKGYEETSIITYNQSFQDFLFKRIQMEVKIKKALDNNEFELYLQPQISTKNENVVSAEALIRWKTEDGFVGPNIFIPIAEDMGIIERLGNWVIDEAVKHVHRLHIAGISCPVAVNISAKQMNRRLVNKLTKLVEDRIIKGEDISIEITESVLLHFLDLKVELLNEISELGIKIAIDDFGVGYSSMQYLRALPLNTLKIDQYFIKHMRRSKDKALLRAIIVLANEMSLESIAEGVETQEQLDLLRELHVDTIQGWYYEKALAINEFIDYMQASLGNRT